MRFEEDVPLEERYLLLEGHLSAKTRQTVRKGFRRDLAPTSRVCFVSAAYTDLPLPKEFDTVFAVGPKGAGAGHADRSQPRFHAKHLAAAVNTHVSIVEALDTSNETLRQIPDGGMTICVLEFPDGVPYMIDDLPTVKDWGESPECVVLCSRETLQAMMHSTRRGGAQG